MTLAGAVFLLAASASAAPSLVWKYSSGEQTAARRFRRLMEKAQEGLPALQLPVEVTIFPDMETLAAADNDSRFALFSVRPGGVQIHVCAAAPQSPDLVSPVFASALFAAAYPPSVKFPLLLDAYGAWRMGSWWGKTPRQWAALLACAQLLSPPAVLVTSRPDPQGEEMLNIGEAAAVLEAWSRASGEKPVLAALASGTITAGEIAPYVSALSKTAGPAPGLLEWPNSFLRGFSFSMSNNITDGYLSRRSNGTLFYLRNRDFASAVSVIPFAFERTVTAPAILTVGHGGRGESIEATLQVIRDAHACGMVVLVKPQIWIWRGFTGDIAMTSERDWQTWFACYRAYIIRYAVVAQAGRAEMFDVGVELGKTEWRLADWSLLITAVRQATGAALTYSCNWGRGAAAVPFWPQLDAIGVDFYDPLSANPEASEADLNAGARAALTRLQPLARRFAKPVVLTEAGYPSVSAAWLMPSEEETARPFSEDDQARCVRALLSAIHTAPWCGGVFWWKVMSAGRPAGVGRKTFDLAGRPAEKIIRDEYRRRAEHRK